jgi:hypothetical protein
MYGDHRRRQEGAAGSWLTTCRRKLKRSGGKRLAAVALIIGLVALFSEEEMQEDAVGKQLLLDSFGECLRHDRDRVRNFFRVGLQSNNRNATDNLQGSNIVTAHSLRRCLPELEDIGAGVALAEGLSTTAVCCPMISLITGTGPRGSLGSHDSPEPHLAKPENSASTGLVKSEFRMASAESDGFFRDIRNEDWKRYKARPRLMGQGWQGSLPHVWFQENWEPSFTCTHERRIGGNGDGPKWVCDPHRIDPNRCLVYSFGSNNDFSFENAVTAEISAGCEIHTFDPTVGSRPSSESSASGLRLTGTTYLGCCNGPVMDTNKS